MPESPESFLLHVSNGEESVLIPFPPDPYATVDNPPWDKWIEPRGESGSFPDLLGIWFFNIGMMLWEIEEGLHPARDILLFDPPAKCGGSLLSWIDRPLDRPLPRRCSKRKNEARLRRAAGVAVLRELLMEEST